MIRRDTVLGRPLVQYTDTRANIESIPGCIEGMLAYATDVNKLLGYNGVAWVEITGSGGTGVLPSGIFTGDFVRYNAGSEQWEVASEPIALKGLVLTPALASLIDVEGAIYYNSATKSIMVCTDI